MRYGILGTTQAHRPDGTPVALGGARLRALLTALALHPGRARTAESLIDEVWSGAGPPADALGALQALVGRLRRALGHTAVVSAGGGYLLSATPDDVDLHRFDRLAADGARALADGDPGKAAGLLDEALALWRGPALADLPDRTGPAARAEARRFEARRAGLAAGLALGRADQALPELTALCADHPLDEPLQALRLRALRDTGRPADALAAYESVRRAIADRLGTDPSPELRALHAELLAPAPVRLTPGGPPRARWGEEPYAGPVPAGDRPAPAPHARAAAPGQRPRPAAAPGSDGPYGREGASGQWSGTDPSPRVGGSSAAGGAEAAGPAGTEAGRPYGRERPPGARPGEDAGGRGSGSSFAGTAAVSGGAGTGPGETGPLTRREGNLRARLTSFVGREEDLATLRSELSSARLVTLIGPGGAGKTRLAQEAAAAMAAAGAWPDGVWFAELAPVGDPSTVAEAVLTTLGGRETVIRSTAEGLRAAADPSLTDPLPRLAEHCAQRSMLVVLDNCEHVVDAAAEVAETLLTHCPGVTVLATSREPLTVPGELARPLAPLPDAVALRLLAERGAAARPGFRTEDDPEACAEICRRLDGLPLAIELAAARLRALSPRQIAARLDDRFRLLTSGSRTEPARRQTLRAVVDWSWDLLDAREQTVLSHLAVFAGGCDLRAAEAVCGTGPEPAPDGGPAVDARDVPVLLGSLVDKSLVVAEPAPDGDMRYRLLETVGEYAAERLDEAGQRAAAERRHLVHHRELARTADPLLRGPEQRVWLERLEREHDNLRAALRRAVAARDEHEALCLVLSLAWFWQLREHRTDARAWSTAAAELGPDPFLPPVAPAPPLTRSAIDDPPPIPPDLLEEARRGVRLIALVNSDEDMMVFDSPHMRQRLLGVVAAYRPGLPQCCRVPGLLWFYAVLLTGDFDQLREIVEAAVDTCRRLGYDWERAYVLQTRAKIMTDRPGTEGRARADADESLEIFQRLGDAWGIAEALSCRGEAREWRGEYEAAAEDYRAAHRAAENLGAIGQLPVLRARLAGVLMEFGKGEEAEAMLREALLEGQRLGGEAAPFARIHLAVWLGRTGRTDEAREQLGLLLEEFRGRTPEIFHSVVEGITGWLDIRDGRTAEALVRLREALVRSRNALAEIVVPTLPVTQLLAVARALAVLAESGAAEAGPGEAGRTEAASAQAGPAAVRGAPPADPARVAATLIGAYDALRSSVHHPPAQERENRSSAEAAARAALGAEAYASAYGEGGGLPLEEAITLALA